MKNIVSVVILTAMVGVVSAGDMEQLSVSADKLAVNISEGIQISVPVPETAPAVSAQKVKAEYLKLNEPGQWPSPTVAFDKLPAAAQEQLKEDNAKWGPAFFSVARKLVVEGTAFFIIQNNNDSGISVNIFDAGGKNIAHGSQSAGGEFAWGDPGAASAEALSQSKNAVLPSKRGNPEPYLGYTKTAVDCFSRAVGYGCTSYSFDQNSGTCYGRFCPAEPPAVDPEPYLGYTATAVDCFSKAVDYGCTSYSFDQQSGSCHGRFCK
jgi:hypothetical protein